MKVLILSCNTGEGHNSAGKAIKEYIESHGDQAEFIDLMMLSGKKTSNAVGGLYVNVVKHCPHLFWAGISAWEADFFGEAEITGLFCVCKIG